MKVILKDILFFPKFIIACFLALIFGIVKYRKGLNWVLKWLEK